MERWLSYKSTCHVILLAKLHDMYLYKAITFPHQPLKSVSKMAFLHRFHCFCQDVALDEEESVIHVSPLSAVFELYRDTGRVFKKADMKT